MEGYYRGLRTPKLSYKEVSKSADKAKYEVWYNSMNKYLDDNAKWAKEMRKSSIKKDDKTIKKLLEGYVKSRKKEDLLEKFTVEEAGKAKGTFGTKRFLIVLAPKKGFESEDRKLIEIKEVYQDEDNKYYYNPYKHHGIRMIKASKLYAPELELGLGYTTYKGQEYWGREIPAKNAKIKDRLTEFELVDIAYSVATQLGKAHAESLEKEVKVDTLLKHFTDNFDLFVGIGIRMNNDLVRAYQQYIETVGPQDPDEIDLSEY
jgi:hypothetical protein